MRKSKITNIVFRMAALLLIWTMLGLDCACAGGEILSCQGKQSRDVLSPIVQIDSGFLKNAFQRHALGFLNSLINRITGIIHVYPEHEQGQRIMKSFYRNSFSFGGKGVWARLADRLKKEFDFNTPDSIYITIPDGWAKFIEENQNLVDRGNKLILDDMERHGKVTKQTRKQIDILRYQFKFPGQLEELIRRRTKWLKGPIIIRSSGRREDSYERNLAGIFISPRKNREELIVQGVKEVYFQAMDTIWAKPHDFSIQEALPDILSPEDGFAVIIQPFIDFDAAGTAMSNYYGHTSIEAVIGDARTAVRAVSANTANFLFKKGDDEFVYNPSFSDMPEEFSLKGKDFKRPDYEAKMKEVISAYPKINGVFSPLSEKQVKKLNQVVNALEQEIGVPLDIEWGVQGDELYILQIRPIIGDFRKPLVEIDEALEKNNVIARTRIALGHTQSKGFTGRVVLCGDGVAGKNVEKFERGINERYIRVQFDVASCVMGRPTKAAVLVDPYQGSRQAHNINMITDRISKNEFAYSNGPVLRPKLFDNLDFYPHPDIPNIWLSRQEVTYFSNGLEGIFIKGKVVEKPGKFNDRQKALMALHEKIINQWEQPDSGLSLDEPEKQILKEVISNPLYPGAGRNQLIESLKGIVLHQEKVERSKRLEQEKKKLSYSPLPMMLKEQKLKKLDAILSFVDEELREEFKHIEELLREDEMFDGEEYTLPRLVDADIKEKIRKRISAVREERIKAYKSILESEPEPEMQTSRVKILYVNDNPALKNIAIKGFEKLFGIKLEEKLGLGFNRYGNDDFEIYFMGQEKDALKVLEEQDIDYAIVDWILIRSGAPDAARVIEKCAERGVRFVDIDTKQPKYIDEARAVSDEIDIALFGEHPDNIKFKINEVLKWKKERQKQKSAKLKDTKPRESAPEKPGKLKMLILEDESVLLEAQRGLLRGKFDKQEYEFFFAATYIEALEILEGDIDVVFFDLTIEKEEGRELFYQSIRETPYLMAVSGIYWKSIEDVLREHQAGDDLIARAQIMQKPYTTDEFLATVKSFREKQVIDYKKKMKLEKPEKLRLLFVHDDPDKMDSFKEVFNKHFGLKGLTPAHLTGKEFEVFTASTQDEAVEVLLNEAIDHVIMDWMLGDIAAVNLLNIISKKTHIKNVDIITGAPGYLESAMAFDEALKLNINGFPFFPGAESKNWITRLKQMRRQQVEYYKRMVKVLDLEPSELGQPKQEPVPLEDLVRPEKLKVIYMCTYFGSGTGLYAVKDLQLRFKSDEYELYLPSSIEQTRQIMEEHELDAVIIEINKWDEDKIDHREDIKIAQLLKGIKNVEFISKTYDKKKILKQKVKERFGTAVLSKSSLQSRDTGLDDIEERIRHYRTQQLKEYEEGVLCQTKKQAEQDAVYYPEKLKILFVHDHESYRNAFKRFLVSKLGLKRENPDYFIGEEFEVHIADYQYPAMDILAEQKIDLMITDWIIQDVSAERLLEAAKEEGIGKVYVYTAAPGYMEEAKRIGRILGLKIEQFYEKRKDFDEWTIFFKQMRRTQIEESREKLKTEGLKTREEQISLQEKIPVRPGKFGVLFVDDDGGIITAHQVCAPIDLDSKEYNCFYAFTYEQAIEALADKTKQIDVAVFDIWMPGDEKIRAEFFDYLKSVPDLIVNSGAPDKNRELKSYLSDEIIEDILIMDKNYEAAKKLYPAIRQFRAKQMENYQRELTARKAKHQPPVKSDKLRVLYVDDEPIQNMRMRGNFKEWFGIKWDNEKDCYANDDLEVMFAENENDAVLILRDKEIDYVITNWALGSRDAKGIIERAKTRGTRVADINTARTEHEDKARELGSELDLEIGIFRADAAWQKERIQSMIEEKQKAFRPEKPESLTVLWIEDEMPELEFVVKERLSKNFSASKEYKFLYADSIGEATSLIKENNPDVMVFDANAAMDSTHYAEFAASLTGIKNLYAVSLASKESAFEMLGRIFDEQQLKRIQFIPKESDWVRNVRSKVADGYQIYVDKLSAYFKQRRREQLREYAEILKEWQRAYGEEIPKVKAEISPDTIFIVNSDYQENNSLESMLRENLPEGINIVVVDAIWKLEDALDEAIPSLVITDNTIDTEKVLGDIFRIITDKNPKARFIVASKDAAVLQEQEAIIDNVIGVLEKPYYFQEVMDILKHRVSEQGLMRDIELETGQREVSLDTERLIEQAI